MRLLTVIIMVLASAACIADPQYRPVSLPGGDFEGDISAWPLTSEYSVGNYGRDGGKALKCSRSVSGYDFMARPLTLKPGSSYRVSWWAKIEGELPGDGAAVSVDWYANGAWVSFTMLYLTNTTNNEWKHFSGEFTAPTNEDFSFLLLAYLRSNTVGTVYFDDFTLEEITGESNVYPLNVSNGIIAEGTPVELAVFVSGDIDVPYLNYRWLDADGNSVADGVADVFEGRAFIATEGAPAGDYILETQPVEADSDYEYPVYSTPVRIAEKHPARVYIDHLGRCIADGKPFMPLGFFGASVAPHGKGNIFDVDLQVYKDSPFDTVLPYNGVSPENLDACAEAGVKIIYSFTYVGEDDSAGEVERIVTAYKDNPAILSWYIADERPKNMVPMLEERKDLINKLDPDHPVYGVFCSFADMPYYGATHDVAGIDPYPIGAADNKGMSSVYQALKDTMESQLRTNGTMALWGVIQAHNVGVYYSDVNSPTFFQDTRPPSEKEMMAMTLLHAIYGAKGFIYYSEFDLKKFPENTRYDERWAELCRIGNTMRELEPFIMADAPRIPVNVEIAEGVVAANALADDSGRIVLLITSVERGNNSAEIFAPDLPAGLVSTTGNTVEAEPGIYKFSGTDADYDILVMP